MRPPAPLLQVLGQQLLEASPGHHSPTSQALVPSTQGPSSSAFRTQASPAGGGVPEEHLGEFLAWGPGGPWLRQGWQGSTEAEEGEVEGSGSGGGTGMGAAQRRQGSPSRAACSRGLGFPRRGTRVMPEMTGDGPSSRPVGCGLSSERIAPVQVVGGRGCYQLVPWSPTAGHCSQLDPPGMCLVPSTGPRGRKAA